MSMPDYVGYGLGLDFSEPAMFGATAVQGTDGVSGNVQ